jgi:hypothetical protein
MSDIVTLHESNAGHLFIIQDSAPCGYDVTPIFAEQPGTFEEHAVTILDGETADWTVDQVPAKDLAAISVVATYDGQGAGCTSCAMSAAAWRSP